MSVGENLDPIHLRGYLERWPYMKFWCKRLLFYFLLVVSIACFVGGMSVFKPVSKLPAFSLTRVHLILCDIAVLFAAYFLTRYYSSRKKSRSSFYENQVLLNQALNTFCSCPIAYIASEPSIKYKNVPTSIQKDGLYVLPEANASKEEIGRAVAAVARLYAGLKQQESATYSDYSESTLNFCIRKKGSHVWTVQVKSVGWGAKQTLFFSPDGKTRELEGVAFFPPKKIAESWFV